MSVRMPRQSLGSRLATLYTVLLGVTVLIVVIASSIALVYELAGFSNDIIIAKHEEARFLAARYQNEGETLAQSAPRIAHDLSGIGLRVAVYDKKGAFLGGDKGVHPDILDRVLRGAVHLAPPPARMGAPIEAPPAGRPHQTIIASGPHDWWAIIAVEGGYVTFEASAWIIFANLIPYWWIIFGIAVVALVGIAYIAILVVTREFGPEDRAKFAKVFKR